MNYYDRKAMYRREMLGCAKFARAALKYDSAKEAAAWNAKAAERLFKLGGLLGSW